MKLFVVGDIHGAASALNQCLKRSEFDHQNDEIIFLGDYCDGWPQTKEVVDIILNIPNRVCLMGNHDLWFLEYIRSRRKENIWLSQGGKATLESYKNGVSLEHEEFFYNLLGYVIKNGMLFVHGGFDPSLPIEKQKMYDLCWDRELFKRAKRMLLSNKNYKYGTYFQTYNKVFIGHTSTSAHSRDNIYQACNVYNLDQGAGWDGRLSMYDIYNNILYQSDVVMDLYPDYKGRFDF